MINIPSSVVFALASLFETMAKQTTGGWKLELIQLIMNLN